MLRIALFVATNIAILLLLSLTFSLFGIEGLLADNGVSLNLSALLVYSAVIGMTGACVSLLLSKFLATKTMGVHIIRQPRSGTEQWLLTMVQQQAKKAGIGMPEVGIFDHDAANAFATGWNKHHALVAVSTGLLEQLQQDEVEAVLAHEVSHIANGDMVTMALLQGVVNTFVVFLSRIIGHVVDRVVFKVERGHGPAFWIVSIVAELVLGVLAMMIVMWFSRYRECRADAGGARLSSRKQMVSALMRLKQRQHPAPMPDEMAALAINAGRVHALFASHPPLEERIRALQTHRMK